MRNLVACVSYVLYRVPSLLSFCNIYTELLASNMFNKGSVFCVEKLSSSDDDDDGDS